MREARAKVMHFCSGSMCKNAASRPLPGTRKLQIQYMHSALQKLKSAGARCGRARGNAQRQSNGEGEAAGVDDEMGKAPVGIQHPESDLHVVAPRAQILFEVEAHGVGGVVEGEVGYVGGDRLAGAVGVVAAQ